MIAEVYPVKRMPRRFSVFDYEIPEELRLARGEFVRIPFRNEELQGVVARVKEGGGRGIRLKPIRSRLKDLVPLSEAELCALERVAFDAAQSVGTILHAAIPRMARNPRAARPVTRADERHPLRIPANEVPSLTLAASQIGRRPKSFFFASDLRRATVVVASYLREHPDEPCLVLLPGVRDAELVAAHLGPHEPILVTGEEPPAARVRSWRQWRASKNAVLVGTRLASLWTHPALGAIFLLRSGNDSHKQQNRNPRFDARDVSDIVGSHVHARVIRSDVIPRVRDLSAFGAHDLLGPRTRPTTAIADMSVERLSAPHPRIGTSAVVRISQVLSDHGRVLCVYNVKGAARRLQCTDCGYGFPCAACGGVLAPNEQTVTCRRCGSVSPVPISCPTCGGNTLQPKGFGNRAVAAAMQTAFPEATVACLDKEHSAEPPDTTDILVVTRHYFENVFDPFRPVRFGLVIDLDADLPLFEPSRDAMERTATNAEEWRGLALASHADYLVQTDAPGLFQELLSEPERVLADDLATRKAYGQPPYSRVVTIGYRVTEPLRREHALRAISDRVRSLVPEAAISGRDTLKVSVPTEAADALLRALGEADDAYIIDTRPVEW